jgi:hypothetical protein
LVKNVFPRTEKRERKMSQKRGQTVLRQESAEALALQALGWLASDDGRLGGFLAASGLSPAALTRRAEDGQVLAGVLDHLLADEALLLACAADLELRPEDFAPARSALPGGDAPHWT